MKIDLVVFDMAGTTVRDDDTVNRCLNEALRSGGVEATRDEINALMGVPKPVAIATLLQNKLRPGPASAAEIDRVHTQFVGLTVEFYQTDPRVEPMPGAMDCFCRLKDMGVKIALDTGFSRGIVDCILNRLGWSHAGLLDATVASDEVARGRPHPDLIFEAMRRTGVGQARRVAKVGDTPSDLQEGQAAGCGLVVGITNGTHTHKQLEPHDHTNLIDSLIELPALIIHQPLS
jgi:phosphonatase-like hydrolase